MHLKTFISFSKLSFFVHSRKLKKKFPWILHHLIAYQQFKKCYNFTCVYDKILFVELHSEFKFFRKKIINKNHLSKITIALYTKYGTFSSIRKVQIDLLFKFSYNVNWKNLDRTICICILYLSKRMNDSEFADDVLDVSDETAL